MFSPMEKTIVTILSKKKKPMEIRHLVENVYQGKPTALNPNTVIGSAILRINKKCKHLKLDWCIKGEGRGRAGKTVWIQKNT